MGKILEPLIPETVRRADRRRQPEEHSNRAMLNNILWVLRTGATWADLPDRSHSGSTCFRRFSRWVKSSVLRQIRELLAQHLEEPFSLPTCFSSCGTTNKCRQ